MKLNIGALLKFAQTFEFLLQLEDTNGNVGFEVLTAVAMKRSISSKIYRRVVR
jgi:hypothetical protein